jgi:hypothetical protein
VRGRSDSFERCKTGSAVGVTQFNPEMPQNCLLTLRAAPLR